MIEIPRAALTADEIAEEAEFFSFGTNDLTQMTFGFSRDDTGNIIKEYREKGIFEEDPFQSIDPVSYTHLTLLNAILGEKIAIATEKPQTTRNTIRGIYTRQETEEREGVQMIFIDTPGIHKPKNKLGDFMTEAALNTFHEVDGIIFITDDRLSKGPGDPYILEMLKKVETPKLLVINKIDKTGRCV